MNLFIPIIIFELTISVCTRRDKGTVEIFTLSTEDIMCETMETQLLERHYFLFLNLTIPTKKDYTSITTVRQKEYP
jgi:hypothetical protein